MASRQVKYYFGRLNLIANYTDKGDFLFNGLRTGKYLKRREHVWGFFEATRIEDELGPFLHGYLVKYRPETDEEVVVPETHRLSDEPIENRVVAKSRFFLHIESGIIAYHPITGSIGIRTFCKQFVELFQRAFDDMFVNAEILTIEDRLKIFDAIEKFRKVSRVRIYLHPSNPSNSERWKSVSDRLKELRASTYREQYDGKPGGDGMEIRNDADLTSKITMADDGYGKASVKGELAGEEKTVSTQDNPVSATAPEDSEPADSVLHHLNGRFRNIFDRFRS